MPAEISTAQPLSAEPMARAQFSNSFGARIGTKPFCIALAAAQPTDKIRWAYLFWTRKAICMARPLWGATPLVARFTNSLPVARKQSCTTSGEPGMDVTRMAAFSRIQRESFTESPWRKHLPLPPRRGFLQARAVDKNSFLLCKRFRAANQFDSRRS